MNTQPDDRAPVPRAAGDWQGSVERALDLPRADALDEHARAGTLERVLALVPAEHHAEVRAHWAGRPLEERARHREVATEEDWEVLRARLAAERAQVWRDAVPREFADAHPDKLARDQHRDQIRAWWLSDSRILYLRGSSPGTGKTYAAYAVGNAVCDRVWCAAWIFADLVNSQLARDSDTRERAWKVAQLCDLLILDDLGQEMGVGWEHDKAREMLHRLLSARAGADKRTIITTNRDGAWIESPEGYGSAIADRLAHDAVPLLFEGESRRAPAAVDWGTLG